jgi:hypothetical protein
MNLYRSDFLEKLTFTRETREFLFLPIDYIFRTKNKRTELDIIGIVETGHRCLVKVINLEIFVDVLVSDVFVEGIKEKFSKIDEMLFDLILSFPPQSHTEQKPLKYVILEQLPGKGFSKPLKYARLFFETKTETIRLQTASSREQPR